MLFDEYQEIQQVWRWTPPTNVYYEDEWATDDGWSLTIGYEDISTSGGIYKSDFFNESHTNIEISLNVSGPTSIVLCGQISGGDYVPLTTFTATTSGNVPITYTISGLTFYTGLGFIFSTGVSGSVDYVYVGDKTVATKDDEIVDNVWKYIGSITGRIESVGAGYSAIRNNQTFADLSELDYVPIAYKSMIVSGDGIIDTYGIQRQVLGQPEIYSYMMDTMVLYLRRSQWSLNNE